MYKFIMSVFVVLALVVFQPLDALAKMAYKKIEAGSTHIADVITMFGNPVSSKSRKNGMEYEFYDPKCHDNSLIIYADALGVVSLVKNYPKPEFGLNTSFARSIFGHKYTVNYNNGHRVEYYIGEEMFVEYYKSDPDGIMCINFYGQNFLNPPQPTDDLGCSL